MTSARPLGRDARGNRPSGVVSKKSLRCLSRIGRVTARVGWSQRLRRRRRGRGSSSGSSSSSSSGSSSSSSSSSASSSSSSISSSVIHTSRRRNVKLMYLYILLVYPLDKTANLVGKERKEKKSRKERRKERKSTQSAFMFVYLEPIRFHSRLQVRNQAVLAIFFSLFCSLNRS